MPVSVPRSCLPVRYTAPASPPERSGAVGVAQPHSAAPGRALRLLGPLRDRLPLRLRDERHDPDGHVVRLRRIERGELHAAVPE
jgi:hypothetical protein